MAKIAQTESSDRRILDIAAAHIRRFGFRRTTVVAIADEAGMSHANVYRYFPSKQALLEAVTDHWLKPLEAEIREIGDGPDPAYDKLERIIGAAHSAYRIKLEVDPHLFAAFVEATEKGLAIARRHRGRLQSELQRTIEDGMSTGVFVQADVRRVMALVFDSLHRFLHPVPIRMDAEAPKAQYDARFERALRLLMTGLTRGRSYDR